MSRIKESIPSRVINGVLYGLTALFTLCCLIPFWLVFSVSITSEDILNSEGYGIFPKEISFLAYRLLFSDTDTLVRAYGVTTFITVTGTLLALILISLMAYPMSRKDFKYRNFFALYIFFTMLFSGGLVPTYILMTRFLHLQDTVWSMIVPGLVSGYYVLLMRNYFSTIPDSFRESAKMDGANEFTVFFRIILPLSMPSIATVSLFLVLGYWNEWFSGLLYLNTSKYIPLQLLLVKLLNNMDFMRQHSELQMLKIEFPSQSVRMATVMVVIGPIVLAYPFFQKYIVKGLMVGGIKG